MSSRIGHMRNSGGGPVAKCLTYMTLTAIALAMLLPHVWMLKTSLQSDSAVVMDLQRLVPQKTFAVEETDILDWKQFADALRSRDKDLAILTDSLSTDAKRTVERLSKNEEISMQDRDDLLHEINQIFAEKNLQRTSTSESAAPSVFSGTSSPPSQPDEAISTRLEINRRFVDRLMPLAIRPARRFHWDNYSRVIIGMNFARAFLNSVIVTACVTIGLVITSSLAAYAFARMEFFGRDHIFMGYLATMMVPTAVTMVPVFILLRQLGWVNTYWALIVPPMFSAYGVFMLRQFFLGIPKELEEAAMIDGCSLFGSYWRIIMPLSKPGLAALAILTFMGSWRSFMWPLIATNTPDMATLPVALSQFQEMFGVRWTLLMTGSIIMIVPMLAAFIFGQKFFIEGIQVGAVKG
jgi:multiple sugar transport system permease protein